MDDGAGYHTSKKPAKWRQKIGLNRAGPIPQLKPHREPLADD